MKSNNLHRHLLPSVSALLVALAVPVGFADEVARVTGLDKTGPLVTLRFASVAGVTYTFEGSNDFLAWSQLTTLLGTGGEMTVPLAGEGAQDSRFFRVAWQNTSPVPGGFEFIPAGIFQMGQTGIAEPAHAVNLSAFYLGKHEVSKALWDTVRAWGLLHGYTDLPIGDGKAADHPVHTVNWFAMVKWCNARSEKEGFTPCYTVSGATYKTGVSNPVCDWNANGYRLPSEAEWEKTARGGMDGRLFPWGDIINHSHSNYNNYTYIYESPQNKGFHPDYSNGDSPYSSPQGSFAPNGYGLHDMAGNMRECCWDWHDAYPSASQDNPRGPATGSYRMIRGGSWLSYAPDCRVAFRYYGVPGLTSSDIGFRVARSVAP